jgi:microcompartment protein CcmK/EutM
LGLRLTEKQEPEEQEGCISMRIARVIGTVSLVRCLPAFVGARWKIVQPFSLEGLVANKADGEEIVMLDELGAGIGSKIGIGEGAEATMPFKPAKKPLDAYCSCILDDIHLGANVSS